MFIECEEFYETENAFLSKVVSLENINFSNKKLVVKAHEKEIYTLSNSLIEAVIHRDNSGEYPFSKVDFLSHKLQEIVFPEYVPKIYFGFFNNKSKPSFILERIALDNCHKAYNIKRQRHHIKNKKDYYFDEIFFKIEKENTIDALAEEHFTKVNKIQKDCEYFIDEYGIAFDHSHVNIAWKKNGEPISLEVHKCRRDYLFNYRKCFKYIDSMDNSKSREEGLRILKRIKQLI